MTDDQNTERRRRLSPNLLLLLLLFLLLCLCMASPALANVFDPLKPVAAVVEPIVCRVPQLAMVALFCPQGERGAYNRQPFGNGFHRVFHPDFMVPEFHQCY